MKSKGRERGMVRSYQRGTKGKETKGGADTEKVLVGGRWKIHLNA